MEACFGLLPVFSAAKLRKYRGFCQLRATRFFAPSDMDMKSPLFTPKFFAGAAAAVLVLNLFIGIDLLSIWDGAEAYIGLGLRGAEPQVVGLHAWWQQLLWGLDIRELLWYRLTGGLLLFGSGVALYFWGRPILGERSALLTLLVLGSGLLWIQAGRFASGDAWLVSGLTVGSIALLRHLKQSDGHWQLAFWGAYLFSALVSPLQTLIWSLVLFLLFRFYHPQGKQLKGWHFWLAGGLSSVWFALHMESWGEGLYSYYRPELLLNYLLLTLLGILPWIGFAFAGFRDTYSKLRKGEELALIHMALLTAGLLSMSLLPQVALALIIARQVMNYELPNYPFRNWVRMPAILHLLLVFCLGAVAMILGFMEFGAPGFRLLMGLTLPYWVGSFISLIGIYGVMPKYYLGGITASGILLTLIFWIQVGPVWEAQRNLPIRVADFATLETTPLQLPESVEETTRFRIHCIDAGVLVRTSAGVPERSGGLWILPEAAYDSLPGATSIRGTWQGVQAANWWLWKGSGAHTEQEVE
jgi:hypothetical protein